MKTDRLEEFVRSNKDSFDAFEPNPAVWQRIEKRKGRVIQLDWKQVAWRAAVVAVVFAASWIINDLTDSQRQPQVAEESRTSNEEQPQIIKDLMEAEIYYTSQISMKRDELFILAGNQPGVMEDVDSELIDLDNVYQELKKDLNDNAANEEILEAMIQNYRLKLQILEDMLYMIRQNEADVNSKSNENVRTAL